MKYTITVTTELRILLQTLFDKGFRYIMRDPAGDCYAYQERPYYVREEDYYDTDSDMMLLYTGTCDMMILDHDLDIPEGVDYFADVYPEEPIVIEELLA